MLRITTLAVPCLLFATACAGGSSPPPPGGDTPALPGDQIAVSFGVSVLSRDASGAPRLVRSIGPRVSLARAGATPDEVARDHVAALAPLWQHRAPVLPLANTGTQRLRNGATVVKLAQEVEGIPIHGGELRVLLHPGGELAAISGTLSPPTGKPQFVLSAREAIERALDHFYGAARPRPALADGAEAGGWQSFTAAAHPDLAITSLRARKELTAVDGRLAPVWAVELFGDDAPSPAREPGVASFAGRQFLVADGDRRIVADINLVAADAYVYRAFAETTGNRRPLDGPLEDPTPHPTGAPDGTVLEFIQPSLVTIETFNGPRDPWLAPNATTTSGNNAVAFSDLDGTGTFTDGDLRPSVRGGRVLNHPFDPNADPLTTPDQLHAGAINAFFVVNWLHDWWYDSGFTEAIGNAQVDNFGRGGLGGDPIVVRAQNGARTGLRNNAFMGVPADGGPPQMLMFLFTSGLRWEAVTEGETFVGDSFVLGLQRFDLTGELATAAPRSDGCAPSTNVAGKIALLVFSGACNSRVMVDNAAAAGAIGVVIADPDLEQPRSFGGSQVANLPGLAVGKSAGQRLLAQIAAGPVELTIRHLFLGPERDSDFDNLVVAHEWGHYLHRRLTLCDFTRQCTAMSEGWGDFIALLMSLRDGDDRSGAYAIGTYATADGVARDPAYFGVRRFPYSTDRNKNDLSFRHISDAEPLPDHTPGVPRLSNSSQHASGEVWASMLWEGFQLLIDEHGVAVARRRMSDYVVAGMLLTPPDATFTEGRDAILAAASALDSDDMLLMAAGFAGRGAGTCAKSPALDDFTNESVVENGTLAARIEVGTPTLHDDGVSCDHDGFLDPGESGTLRISVHNSGPVAAEEVRVTPALSLPGVRIGAPIAVGVLAPFTTVELAFPVTIAASAPRNTRMTIQLTIAGDGSCEQTATTVTVSQPIGVDETVAASRTDTVEAASTPWTVTGFIGINHATPTTQWTRAAAPSGTTRVWHGINEVEFSDTQLVSPEIAVSATAPFSLAWSHAWQFETNFVSTHFDGGVIELSTDGGVSWSDVSTFGVDPGYTGVLVRGGSNPLEDRPAYGAISPGFPALQRRVLDFGTRLAGQTVRLRFRIGTDFSVGDFGWIIDDIEITGTDNTPFPLIVPEVTVCTQRRGGASESRVVAMNTTPITSLAEFDAAVCIASDAP